MIVHVGGSRGLSVVLLGTTIFSIAVGLGEEIGWLRLKMQAWMRNISRNCLVSQRKSMT